MPKLIDLTGQRFGRLTVLGRTEVPPNRETQAAWWLCDCDCGTKTSVAGDALRSGRSQSCGCSRYRRFTGRSDPQLSFRPPLDGRMWLEAHARRTDRSMNAILIEALAEYRARRPGIPVPPSGDT